MLATGTPGPAGNPRPWTTAAGIALGILAVALLLSVLLGPTRPGAPRALGTIVANLLPGCALLGVWARRADRRWGLAGWSLRALACLVLSATTCGLMQAADGQGAAQGAPPMTDAERHGLVIGRDSLRHPGLRFVLPHPGRDYQPVDSATERRMNAVTQDHLRMAAWGLVRPSRGVVAIVAVKHPRLDEPEFRAFIDGLHRGLARMDDARIDRDTTTWDGTRGEYLLAAVRSSGTRFAMRCLGRADRRVPLTVCAWTETAVEDSVPVVLAGLRLDP